MTPLATRAVIVCRDDPTADALEQGLGLPLLRIAPESLNEAASAVEDASEFGIVWIHLVSPTPASLQPYAEAELLLASATAARAAAEQHDTSVVFVAILPMPGLFVGRAGLVYDLALSTMVSLMRSQIDQWTHDGCRIVGLVHAGLGLDSGFAGIRDPESVGHRVPMGRPGTIEPLVNALTYVGSPNSSYLTGILLHVDGGSAAYSWVYPTRDH